MTAAASPSAEMPRDPARSSAGATDTLTVGRLLLLAAAEAFAFWIAIPDTFDPGNVEFWRWLWWTVFFGVSLIGPLIVIPKARRGQPIGLAAHFWLITGLGGWLFAPGMAWARNLDQHPGSLATCLLYTQSMVALWLIVALLATRPSDLWALVRPGPWSERCGLWLAAGLAPLGGWLLFDLYREAFT